VPAVPRKSLLLSVAVVVLTASTFVAASGDEGTPVEPTPTVLEPTPSPSPSDPVPTPTASPTATPHAPVVVIGDSISSVGRYDRYRRGVAGEDPARPLVWWSRVLRDAGVDPAEALTLTEGSSGYLRRGARTPTGELGQCAGTTFAERLDALAQARPHVLLVAGGRNDVSRCEGTAYRPATVGQQRAAIRAFYASLAQTADAIGLPRSQVFVLVPWGSSDVADRARIVREVEAAARAHGLSFVPVPALAAADLQDGIHPNGTGTYKLGLAVSEGSQVRAALAPLTLSLPEVPVPPAAPAAPAAPVSSVCAASERADAGGATWGRAGARGLVDARLARAGRTPLVHRSGASWLDQALAAGASVVGQPQPGDVAWWPNAPRAGLAAGEHVAVVQGVRRGGQDVRVVESGRGRACARTAYPAAALPRVYVRMPRSNGSPQGRVSRVLAGTRVVAASGWAVDPDMASGRTRVRLTVRRGTRVVARTQQTVFHGFAVRAVVPAKHARRGRALTVTVDVLNGSRTRGRSVVRLTTRTVRLR
jgi:lysophospholipase L1-like esterase